MDKRTKIVEMIRRLAAKPIDPSPEESLFESGLLDSFTLVDLVAALDSEFTIRIPDSDLAPRRVDWIARIKAYAQSRP